MKKMFKNKKQSGFILSWVIALILPSILSIILAIAVLTMAEGNLIKIGSFFKNLPQKEDFQPKKPIKRPKPSKRAVRRASMSKKKLIILVDLEGQS